MQAASYASDEPPSHGAVTFHPAELHVDYAAQKRTPERSAAFYREVMAGNRVP
jgi:hypothetical protein